MYMSMEIVVEKIKMVVKFSMYVVSFLMIVSR